MNHFKNVIVKKKIDF